MEVEYSKMSVPRTGFLAPAPAVSDPCLAPTRTWLTARLGEAKETFRKWVTLRRFLLLSFLFPFGIRIIPEILAGPWPLGFDTVWVYAPFVKQVETQGAGPAMAGVLGQHTAPIMYALLAAVAWITQAAPFAVTKATAPLLYGLLGLSLYSFARNGLRWDQRRSLWVVVLSALYFVPLRFSWDMYKNILGLVFFFLGLPYAGKSPGIREKGMLVAFFLLSLLSDELMAVLVAGTCGLLFIWEWIRDEHWDWTILVLSGVGLAMTLFYIHLILPPILPWSPLAPAPSQSGILYNYVGSNVDVYAYPTLTDVYVSVLTLTGFLFAPILLLTFHGFLKERRLVMTGGVLAIGAFSLLVSPYAALPSWNRWLFMLAFPALILATNGFLRLGRKARTGVLVVLVSLAASYIALPSGASLPYYSTDYTLRYMPPSLMRNTVGLEDCSDVVRVATWLNDQRMQASVLVANIWFVGWAKLYVNYMDVYGFVDPSQVTKGNSTSYRHVYVLDWALGQGGFQARLLPVGAFEIYVSGRIAVYEIAR
jgi:hypothetical protein